MSKNYLLRFLVLLPLVWMAHNAIAQLGTVTVTSPAGIAGDYFGKTAGFGPELTPISGELVAIDDGAGATTGCDPAANDLTGKIALIDRGGCAFVTKVLNAQDAGAIAVVVCNNNMDLPYSAITMGGDDMGQATIPAMMLSYNDCQVIKTGMPGVMVDLAPGGPTPGPGEACETATPIPGPGVYHVDSITSGFGATFAGHAKWFTFTSDTNVIVRVNTCGMGVDTRVIVSTDGCDTQTFVTFSDDDCDDGSGNPFASDVAWINPGGQTFDFHFDDANSDDGFDFVVEVFDAPTINVTFTVDMGLTPVDPAGMFIAGNFTGWNQEAMTDNGDGTWSYTAQAESGETLEWKYLNGPDGWEPSGDLAACGVDDGFGGYNRAMFLNTIEDVEMAPVCFGSCDVCPDITCNPNAVICDNFDSYAVGSTTGTNASWWSTWSGTTGGAEDGIVSDDFAFSGSNSMLIAEGQNQDVLLLLGNQNAGQWLLKWRMYIPSGKTGYYNIQEDETPGVAWNLNVFFGTDGSGNTATFGQGLVLETNTNFSYPEDTWFDVVHMIDLDANTLRLFIDGEMVAEMDYDGNLGSIDFFSINDDNRYYVDDVEFVDVIEPDCRPGAIICDNYEFYADGSTTGTQASWWSTWSGSTGGAEDGMVSTDFAYDGFNSMLIAEGQAQDVLLLLGNRSAGRYIVQWKMYIPAGKTGYYNFQESETPGVAWNLEVFFNEDGAAPGTGNIADTGTPFTYPEDQWFDVVHVVDLDADIMTIIIDGQVVEQAFAYPGNLGSIDFFSIDGDNRYYVDVVQLIELPTCPEDALICDDLEHYATNSLTGGQAPWWSTWSGTHGGAEDGIVSDDFQSSGNNSLLIAEGSNQDVLLLLGNQSAGEFELSWNMYIPSESTGYYNIQEDETPGVAWNLNVFFGTDGNGNTATFGEGLVLETGGTFTYPEDRWFNVTHVINLDANTLSLWIDGVEVVTDMPYNGNLGSIDFFSINDDNRYYVDDILFLSLTPEPVDVTFRVDMTNETVHADGVFFAGSINGWTQDAMTNTSGSIWEITYQIQPGEEVQYKFLNGPDGWEPSDQLADCGVDDGFGGYNRVLTVGDMPMVLDPVCFSYCVTCNVVAVDETEFEAGLALQPNPASGQTFLQYNFKEALDLQVTMTNNLGQVLQAWNLENAQSGTLQLDISSVPAGVYFVQITDGANLVTKRLVKE